MLQSDHRLRQYAPPSFSGKPTQQKRRLLERRIIHSLAPSVEQETESSRPTDDRRRRSVSEAGARPSEFQALFEQVRQEMAYRRLMGEVLSRTEQMVLEILNHVIAYDVGEARPEPPEVTQAVEEAKRILSKYKGG